MSGPKRVPHLPLSFNPSNLVDRPQPLLENAQAVDISDPIAKSHAKRGVFSELLTNPEESIDDQLLISGQPPIIPPLEGLLGGTNLKAFPKAKTFYRPGFKRPHPGLNNTERKRSVSMIGDSSVSPRYGGSTMNMAGAGLAGSTINMAGSTAMMTNVGGGDDNNLFQDGHGSGKRVRYNYSKALEPKVLLPYESRPGQTPRKIEIERRKRLYANQSIEVLIESALEEKLGDTPRDPLASKLPLSAFDDVEYDQRTVKEWLDMSLPTLESLEAAKAAENNDKMAVIAADRVMKAAVPVPAKVNLPSNNPAFDCLVTAYDSQENLWKVRFIGFNGWELDNGGDYDMDENEDENEDEYEDETERLLACKTNEAWVERLKLLFLSEDPFLFAKRVASAHKQREEVALNLRYAFYLDCMPTAEASPIPTTSLSKICSIASGSNERLKKIALTATGKPLLDEVCLEYARAMNKELFDHEVRAASNKDTYSSVKLPSLPQPQKAPLTGCVEIAPYDYAKYAKDFSFVSFLTKLESIRTLSKVRVECDKLLTNNLFLTSIAKIVKLDEFEGMQNQSLQNVKTQLKDGWIPTLKNIIKAGFKEVGKGWYNMQESNSEKFMTTVNFIMQDSLRFLVLNSLVDFNKLISSISSQRVVVTDTNDLIPPDNAKRPLFQIDLTFKNGVISYNTDLGMYETAILNVFDKAMTAVESLPQLEPLVLDQMFWATKPNLQIPHNKEPAIAKLREKLRRSLREGLGPLEEYLRTYDKHLRVLNLNINTYAEEYEEENHTIEEMEQDIINHTKDWEALDKDIPSHISLGLFWVSCDSIRAAMRKDLAKVVLDILARRTAKIAQGISQAFTGIQNRLKDHPTKIEELTELRDYMKTIPEECKNQNIKINEMLRNYEILEKYKYEQSNEDFRARWTAYGWPMRIDEMVRATETSLEVDESTFLRNLASDQEVFKERIQNISGVVADFSKNTDLSKLGEIVADVHKVTLELKECQNLVTLFNSRERLFNQEITHYEEVAQLIKDFEPFKSLWLSVSDWSKWKNQWLNGSFLDLNAEEVEKNLTNAWRVMFKSVKYFKNIPGCLAVATQVKDEMDEFKPYLPLIQALRNPGMRDRHWDRLSEELNMKIRPDPTFTLNDALKMQLLEKVEIITKVCDVAGKEYSIEAALDKMDNEWKSIALEILPYKETGTCIMKAAEEITRLLDDHIVMTQSMSFSPFKKPFAERISLWESKLRTVQEVLEAWMACQRSWLYLEPIFASDDIVTQLPAESKRFTTMDRTWRRIMQQAKAKPGVIECCADFKLLDSFREFAFPRFFFLSDDELLQILSQTKDPTAVQPHLRKCFENVAALEFQPDKLITGIFSGEGERIDVADPFYPKGAVEEWLLKVEDQMRKSVKKVIMAGLSTYSSRPRTSWVLDYAGQAVIAVSQTFWTKEVSEALKTGQTGLKTLFTRLLAQLQGLVSLVRGELPFLNRLVLGDLIVIDVHARDVVKKLVDTGVCSENDFEWISQLRYYWEDDDLRVKIVNANFKYGYEYLGNTGRLVITPLTDRCYLTLTGAMHLGMGGAPAGPAGTGKTETTKDLAKALAKHFFKGLAAAGAWACFDEFNRIDIETNAIMFEGVDLPLDGSNAIFITMNPGYAGRTEPVAMMIPNYGMIGEISLFSFGFSNAKILAEKMVATFKLSSEQLSSQDHYDFGMRAVKTVISSAGNLKREQPNTIEDLIFCEHYLFPGVEQPPINYGDILDSLNKTPEASFIKKCIQLYETTVVRHGLMLVGPTGGGKTCCTRVLSRALSALQDIEKVRVHVLNPKSITMGQIYEGIDDGLPDKKWYCFDGPVDAVWVESMNTLLDDNKKLCLSSGEIIKMANTQTMMFEVENLQYASPATVSRCGMIYMEPGALGRSLPPSYISIFRSIVDPLFEHYLEPALKFLRGNIREAVGTTDGNLTISMMRILQCLMMPFVATDDPNAPNPAERINFFGEILESLFLFSIVWSIGATSDADGHKKFEGWLRGMMSEKPPKIPFPENGSIYDYMFDQERKEWANWMEYAPEFVVPQKGSSQDVIVPTMDTIRNTYILHILLHNGCHTLCTGPTGTGKSVTITDKLMKGMDSTFTPLIFSFSARTGANQTQDLIDSKMEKRRKGVFGPPVGKKFVIFVDDLNMPMLDNLCGAQPPIELLRQWLDYGGWYDRKAVGKFMELVDLTFVCGMGPPGGGRNPITQRMTRHFNLLSFVEMEDESLQRIFSTILGSFLQKFPPEISSKTDAIVSASVHIYNTIRAELLPTPAKSHYTFNLRDLAKVVQGVLSADIKTVNIETDIVRLWIHECMRVFQDRLVDNVDKTWFLELVKGTIEEKLILTWQDVVLNEPIIYGDYLTPGADPKIYTEVKDIRRLVKLAEEYLDDYNSTTTSPMRLVMFLDAIEHVSRICRIIRAPMGHALLLGVGGSGRQSLSRLATYMEEYEMFQIEISKNYGTTEWRDDLKKVLMWAGMDAKQVVFLFCDTQIFQEACLEDINNILNGGDVPNIYANDEIDQILNAMRPIALDMGITANRENLFALYIQRVRNNLHLIICMSPIGDAFRNRLRMFPSLVNCCTIDWFSTWPEEALRSVAANSISEVSDLGSEQVIDGIVNLCMYMHESVRACCLKYKNEVNRNNYVTPKSYLELEILQEELEAMAPMLLQTSQETEFAMKKIAVDKVKAEEMKEIVMKEEASATKKAEETKNIAEDAKRIWTKLFQLWLQLLIRSMQRPPEGVKLVIEAICIMKGIKPKKIDGDKPGKKIDDYWEPGKGLLAEPQKFLDSLMNFDKDNIQEAVVTKIKPYIDSQEFQVSVIARVSKAATSMCQWVRAMEKYYWVSRSVAPKRAVLQAAQESLEITLKTVAELKKKMREAEINIKEMEKRYTESVAKKEELSRKVEECNVKLSRAGKLISGLGGEKQRWALTVSQLDQKITNVVGDVLLASGVIAYLGPFTAEYRSDLLREWNNNLLRLKIPHSDVISLWDSLGDPVKLREWELAGLPRDSLSRDNGIIVQNSRRWPLLIDPQGQANKWIRNMEKDNQLDIVKLTDKDFLRTLENAIRFGKPVLLENVGEKLDPALDPVLLRMTFKQGGNVVIKIGDSILPYHEDFRFYITTKLPNPHYSPETSATVTLINFTLAPSGLEDQLLAIVVANERPDLEEAKNQLTINNAQMKKELKDIEDKILYLLSSVQGSPETSEEITSKVIIAEQTEKDIDYTRNKYVPVAVRTRILFFCITELATIDPMYQYSLGWFMNLFISAISHSEKSENIEQRIVNINEYFTFSLFSNVCRSLFEKHKLLFSFLLCIRMMMNDDKIDMDEWKFLLTGAAPPGVEKKLPNPAPDCLALSQLPAFENFELDFVDFIESYRVIFDSQIPHREKLPHKWQNGITPFQRILVLRCIRADRCTSAVQDFVASQLGDRFVEPQTSDLGAVYKESSAVIPLIFVLCPGADPANSLYKFAEEMRFSKKLTGVSLGQGQGPKAEALIREGLERGLWILLQNCHLAPSWMPTLDRIIDGVTPDKVHRDFRLWLTSLPTPKFPVTILQNGVKMTVEPPNGIKANLMRTYSTFTDDYLSQCTKPREWKKLLFALSFFHAVIQERRKFGALGWNIPYEFTDGDLRICIRQLKMFLEEYTEIPFKVLKYTVGKSTTDYYTPRSIDDGYKFSTSEIYVSIPPENLSAYKNYIKSLPIDEVTEIFSMHENANITFAQKETYTMFEILLNLMPRSTKNAGGKTRDEILAETAISIQSRIPKPYSMAMVTAKYPIEYKESMSTVLIQEVIRYNRLLSVIHQTIVELLKALKGLVIFINQVPAAWAAKAYPSLKSLSTWVIDLMARTDFIQKWIDNGIPVVFWISGFFFPQAFLTGTLQNFARKYTISIDTLQFDFKMVDNRWEDIHTKPSDGCYIRGLYLEGARWDPTRRVLAESRPKELYTEMCVIWLLPKANRKKPESGIYECPVYKTLTRAGTLSTTGHSTNYVLTMELPSDKLMSHWVKRGVALITSLGSGW
ncbi:hypothetical protein BCR33DRAFT_714104 [Rhizoclosmatium globosum]|uniref:Dynein heavy chain, cytosolic n=1 Tax=Rhizoclosmatium globosum TaxID=329046 RepID=A0A1Y2CPT9_9FUNG|nr:hypothetical protein BCR33DRAFT_714104 [Rhizoclosmatium globosum]|eukprot:ORY49032.1 hypothetical protein BCR33DRAFT_714104 [Rhizoclosmatium globosum]